MDKRLTVRALVTYLGYVVRHKWFVFVECCRLGVPWRGLIHDWSKLLPSELLPYARHFNGEIGRGRDGTGYYKPTDTGDPAFDFAWLLHQKRNRHHWQWWVLPEDEGGQKVLPMPSRYRREMVADWRGAGRAQGTPGVVVWYLTNRGKMLLHPETRLWVETVLRVEPVSTGTYAGKPVVPSMHLEGDRRTKA